MLVDHCLKYIRPIEALNTPFPFIVCCFSATSKHSNQMDFIGISYQSQAYFKSQ